MWRAIPRAAASSPTTDTRSTIINQRMRALWRPIPSGCSPACALHGMQEPVLRQGSEYQTGRAAQQSVTAFITPGQLSLSAGPTELCSQAK
jgi:hypothetical protein